MNTDPILCSSCGSALDSAAPGGLCPRCLMAAALLPTDPPTGLRLSTPPTVEQVAAAFPQLEVLALIGAGGMGAVFRARQPKLNRLVALKVLPASLAERDPAFAERFEREGQMLARLHHPNIVAVYDSGRAGDFFYLLMEHVAGVNLRQAMRASRFTPAQALAIVPRICDALQFAHDEGVLHRDIKPENILLDAKGRVKLADFGIGKIIGESGTGVPPVSGDITAGTAVPLSSLTQTGTALGTPQYMAPEQRDRPELVDHRADIYSLGVVFYELLTGELPVGKFAPPSELSASDPRVDAIVRQALEKERDRRQHSAGEMKTQVETIAATPDASSSRREEAESDKSEIRNRQSAIPSRFSRTAISGAFWTMFVPLHFILPLLIPIGWANNPLVQFAALLQALAFWTAPVGITLLGWVAVSQIRRSEGKIHGLWLAVFDGLLFPLLALDGAIVGAVFVVLRLLDQVLHRSMASPVGIPILLLAPVVLGVIALVDFLIIRRVWRAVNKTGGAAPATETAEKVSDAGKNAPRAGHAFLVPMPRNRFWKWLIVTVLAAILIPIAIKVIVQSAHNSARHAASLTSADFHYRVFEADAALVDRLIPAAQRQPGVQPTAKFLSQYSPGETRKTVGSGANSFTVTKRGKEDTDSQVAVIGLDTLHELLEGIAKKPGVLVNESKTVTGIWWPNGTATGWLYSTQKDGLAIDGSGGFNLAYTVDDVRDKIRIEGRVNHNPNFAGDASDITANFLYEGDAPLAHALAFLVPFFRKDNSSGYLVVVYEVSPRGNAPPAVAQNLSFGPVLERVVMAFDENPAQACLDLGSGEFHAPPAAIADRIRLVANKERGEPFTDLKATGDERFDWLKTSGVDLIGSRSADGSSRFKYIGQPPHYQNGWTSFDALSPNEVLQTLQSSPFFAGEKPNLPDVYINAMNPNDAATKQASYIIFRTHDGDVGVMKVLGISDNPRGVKIQYKLVQNNVTTVTPVRIPAAAAPNLSFGPVIERTLTGDPGLPPTFLSLHDGTLVFPPTASPMASAKAFADWWRSTNADLMAAVEGEKHLLVSLEDDGAKFTEFPAEKWESASATDTADALRKGSSLQAVGQGGIVSFVLPQSATLPITLAVESRSGEIGILQITGFTENPRGVKIRYKLVLPSAR